MSEPHWEFAVLPGTARLAAPLHPGDEMGCRFRILAQLGSGAMGVVYRAQDRASGREVALKLTRQALADERARERFRREGEITASLHHPGIVAIHSGGMAGPYAWLAYELVEGARHLDEALQGSDLRERVRLVRDAARALGHAHARGVVHRDVKPSNILVDAEGRVRVTDFGLALAPGLERLTQTGVVVGTPQFMPIEQLFPSSGGRVGAWSDVWSLGAILYQALCGPPPYPGGTLAELATQVASGRPRSPLDLDPTLPPDLAAVVLRALEPEAMRRPRDCEALADELDRWLHGAPAPTASSSRKTPWALAPLLAVVLLLAWWATRSTAGDEPGAAAADSSPQGPTPATPAASPEARVRELLLTDPAAALRRIGELEAAPDAPAGLRRQRGLALLLLGRAEEGRELLRAPEEGHAILLERAWRELDQALEDARDFSLAGRETFDRITGLARVLVQRAQRCQRELGGDALPLVRRSQESLLELVLATADLYRDEVLARAGVVDRRTVESILDGSRGVVGDDPLVRRRGELGRAWAEWGFEPERRPGPSGRIDPDPAAWEGSRPSARYAAAGLAFLLARTPEEVRARLPLGEALVAGAYGEPRSLLARRLERDVRTRLAVLGRERAYAARLAGDTAEHARWGAWSLAHARAAVDHPTRPTSFDHAQVALCHLLAGDPAAARAELESDRHTLANGPGILVQAERLMVAGERAAARELLDQLVRAEALPEAYLARAHLRALEGDAAGSREDLEAARARPPDDGALRGELGVPWHSQERIEAVIAGAWWPGAESLASSGSSGE